MIESKEIKNPFPGLRPFETDEYRLFFGREGQSDALIARLQRSRFLAVVGTSGSGKSSLVRAGLLPALRGGMMAGAGSGSGWRIAIMRPGSDPIGNLAHALADKDVLLEAGGALPAAEAEAVIAATLRRGSLGLVDAARQARLGEHEKLLVIADQFEELFRFRAARPPSSTGDDAAAFVKLLIEASQQSELSIYVVPTMRSDFLGDCAQFQGLPEAINDGQYLIPRMTRDERRFAITGPVGVTRGKITEPLVNRLMNDVGDNPDQLPILQHALMRTWDYWAVHRRNGEPIGLEDYEAVGTMSDALSLHADEAWGDLLDERSRRVAEKLFKALTEKGADNREIRRPTRLSEIAATAEVTEDEVVAVIDVFRREGRSFLMPPVGVALKGETVIDISHESLIRNWDRLQKWVDEEAESARIYRRLAEAVVLHREGREGLLIDPALQFALDWRAKSRPNNAWAGRYHPDFAEAMTFLDDSKAAHEADIAAKERQREEQLARERHELEMAREFAEKQAISARRMRWLTVGMAVLFLVSLVTAGYAVKAKWSVERERAKVANLLTETESRRKQIATTLRGKEEADQARLVADKARADAEVERQKALDRAILEEERARKEAERANIQAASADAARKQAEINERHVVAAVNRSELVREGTRALRREKLREALVSFEKLRTDLAALQPGTASPHDVGSKEVRQYQEDYAWTLSNIGATHQKEGQWKAAIDSYRKALDVFAQVLPQDSDDPILYDTYYGLARSYYAASLESEGFPAEAEANFTKAEDFFRRALSFLDQHRPLEAPDGYLNLARLYRESGRLEKAEGAFKQAATAMQHSFELLRQRGPKTGKLDVNERATWAAAQKELADLYQLEGRIDEALKVLEKMVVLQEDVTVPEIAEQGQAIAAAYNDLSELYQEKSDVKTREASAAVRPSDKRKAEQDASLFTQKAENAYTAANMLQRAGLKLRRAERDEDTRTGAERTKLIKDLAADLDLLGDAYARLDKFPDAEAIYKTSLSYRADTGVEIWKSYDKLSKFYRDRKDFAQAESYSKLFVGLYQNKPRSAQYAGALIQLAALYAEAPARSADAESNYRSALKIYADLHDWRYENLILFRLSKFYEKQQRVTEQGEAQRDRVNTLRKYFNELGTNPGPPRNDDASLVSEYLYALNVVAYGNKNSDEAEAFYRQALDASGYIMGHINSQKDLKVLSLYAAILHDYQVLLKKLNKQTDALKVTETATAVRESMRRLEPPPGQQDVQPVQQGPAQATAP